MKINLAKSAGFCFGVKRALDIALKTAGTSPQLYMLGDIVHNEEVVKQIKKAGIKRIRKLTSGKNRILLISAHGISLKTLQKAKGLGYLIVDATCPMVKEIHRIAQEMEQKGYRIIVIGDKRHDEVRGIVGQLKKKAIVIDDIKNIPFKTVRRIKKAGIVVQSTQNMEKVSETVTVLKQYIKELEFRNTICRPTRIKQEEIKILPKENQVMIIIGSKTSANTRRLYEIARSLNQRSFWVNSAKEIRPKWLKGVKSVGVAAGASTPESTIQEIIACLKRIS